MGAACCQQDANDDHLVQECDASSTTPGLTQLAMEIDETKTAPNLAPISTLVPTSKEGFVENTGRTKSDEPIIVTIMRKPGEKLGMDVKHKKDMLIVHQIKSDGAVSRANHENLMKTPPQGVLTVGDIIVRVNDVTGSDTDMVAEATRSTQLVVHVKRPV